MTNFKITKVNDANIHYVEDGNEGDPIIFLHGVPTSSYLWRNIIPTLADKARCIAPDLIGMGKSDKPDIQYTFFDHVKYIEGFIENLGLKNITIVGHGLGAAIGFEYAIKHQENVKALAFHEAHVRPMTKWEMLSLPMQHLFKNLFQNIEQGYKTIVKDNYLLDKLLTGLTLQPLSEDVQKNYKQPFLKEKDRKPLWQYMQDFSTLGAGCKKVTGAMTQYCEYLQQSSIPKLMLYTTPGFFTTMDTVQWCRDNLPNLQEADLDVGLHLPQESNPQLFSLLLRDWYLNI